MEMNSEDKKWVAAGAGCAAGGIIISLISKKGFWAAAGTLLGAGVIGYRIYDNSQYVAGKRRITSRSSPPTCPLQQLSVTSYKPHNLTYTGPSMIKDDRSIPNSASSYWQRTVLHDHMFKYESPKCSRGL